MKEFILVKNCMNVKHAKKTFSRLCHLKKHERLHTGKRPFECKICNKAFSRTSILKIHERVHTGDRPFECKTCNKAFSESGKLRIHERTHTGENRLSQKCTMWEMFSSTCIFWC